MARLIHPIHTPKHFYVKDVPLKRGDNSHHAVPMELKKQYSYILIINPFLPTDPRSDAIFNCCDKAIVKVWGYETSRQIEKIVKMCSTFFLLEPNLCK